MKFDFSNEAYFDNHTHLLFQDKFYVTPDEFAINYYHGVRDGVDEKGAACPSETAVSHLKYQSVNMVLANAMAERFGCEPTIEGATAFRNAHTKTAEDLKAYTKMMYEDGNVVGCTLDCELPIGHPKTLCFPCEHVVRLFRYEDVFTAALEEEDLYVNLLDRVLKACRQAKADGFEGLKGHPGEKYGFDNMREVSEAEAQAAMSAAKQGDNYAIGTVYYAMFSHILELAAELDIPVHLHTGTTGFKKRNGVYQIDPVLMVPFLKNPRYYKTKIALLHGSFPYTRNAAWMAYNFPNVYVDLSQTQLWQGLLCSRILEDLLSVAPHDKIMLGTGQHWYCEMAWLASRIAKKSLADVMERFVDQGLLSAKQAEQSARMVLSENALRLYKKI